MNSVTTSITRDISLRQQRGRLIKDAIVRYAVGLGGVAVIAAVALIFFYLLYVVSPLFKLADAELVAQYSLPGATRVATAQLIIDEQREVGVRYSQDGRVLFFGTTDGRSIKETQIVLPAGVALTSVGHGGLDKGVMAYGRSDGQAHVLRTVFNASYPDDVRIINPELRYPLGDTAIVVDKNGAALTNIVIQLSEEKTTIVAKTEDDRLLMTSLAMEESFMDDDPELEVSYQRIADNFADLDFLLMDKDQLRVYAASRDGWLTVFDISDRDRVTQLEKIRLTNTGVELTALEFLTGDISLLVGDSTGRVTQWFPVRDDDNKSKLTRIRSFELASQSIRAIASETRRKGFVAADSDGRLGLFHATAQRKLWSGKIDADKAQAAINAIAMSPRADAMLVESADGSLQFWHIENEHPEISWSVLWGKVWYESYKSPEYIWQSSSASNDFEPKYSLAPLAFGTLKAAFYAMLFAVPIAIMGAIYTAYFMAPGMRRLVKPGIEIMEALPTVILGFLAGLWLAPVVEKNMVGIFGLLVVVPLSILVFAYLWRSLPSRFASRFPEGWDAALLIPVILGSTVLALWLGPVIELFFFAGDMPGWLSHEMNIDFDQRNAMIVGLAMGFAVIPSIFSMTEDAIFNVPRHLSNGSLALGATQWQTLVRVILLTASPGIFAALMIGLGRAVGETMIVLMATGNTPVLDFSLFQGMRSLSANVAVEVPEAEVASTHYRVLFLAALVLFAFTFMVNTLGELVRQRLRSKYSSL